MDYWLSTHFQFRKISYCPPCTIVFLCYSLFVELFKVFDIPGSSKKLAIVFIDTVLLAGLTHPTLRSLPPVGPVSTMIADTQWDWINQTLSQFADPSANVQWTIVVGHYPGVFLSKHPRV